MVFRIDWATFVRVFEPITGGDFYDVDAKCYAWNTAHEARQALDMKRGAYHDGGLWAIVVKPCSYSDEIWHIVPEGCEDGRPVLGYMATRVDPNSDYFVEED
jgi:hypothetical protein